MDISKLSLENAGTSEKITRDAVSEKFAEISKLQSKIQKITETRNADISARLKNTNLQKDIYQFLENAANGTLVSGLNEYNAKNFDKNADAGLDAFEFGRFSESLSGAIEQIILLDGLREFTEIHNDEEKESGITRVDKWVAGKINATELLKTMKA